MGGGTLWRSVARAVGAAAPTVAATNAVYCSACTATPAPTSMRVASCTCRAHGVQQQQAQGASPVSFGPKQFWDLHDWEFEGDEERDHYVFGAPPTLKEVEEASLDLQNALRLGFVTPTRTPQVGSSPSSSPRFVEVTEVTENSTVTTVGDVEEVNSDLSGPPTEPEWVDPLPIQVTTTTGEAPSSAMMEAFHQFQHNPQIQGVVVALATDKAVWEAVLSNEKIQEFRRNFNNELKASPENDSEQEGESSHTTSNIFSQVFWSTKKVFSRFIQNFQEFMTSLFDTADKNDAGNEKSNLFDRSLKACMMLAVLVLAIVVFKRSVLVRKGDH